MGKRKPRTDRERVERMLNRLWLDSTLRAQLQVEIEELLKKQAERLQAGSSGPDSSDTGSRSVQVLSWICPTCEGTNEHRLGCTWPHPTPDKFCDSCGGPFPLDQWPGSQYGGHWDTCPNRVSAGGGTVETPTTTPLHRKVQDWLFAEGERNAFHDSEGDT